MSKNILDYEKAYKEQRKLIKYLTEELELVEKVNEEHKTMNGKLREVINDTINKLETVIESENMILNGKYFKPMYEKLKNID